MKILRSGRAEFDAEISELRQRRLSMLDQYREDVDREITAYRKDREKFLLKCLREFDEIEIKESGLWIDPSAIKNSHKLVSSELRKSLETVKERIERYHSEMKLTSMQTQEDQGILWSTQVRPLDRVGIYVPGGKAHYFMSLLIAGVAARVAGVKEILVASSPKKKFEPIYVDPLLLYTCKLLKIDRLLISGGPQALAALAFGTESQAPVQKLVGSGGFRTMTGLQRLNSYVDVEGVYGPSETAFVCDSSASVDFVAADIVARSDRDAMASSLVFHSDEKWLRNLVDRLAQSAGGIKDGASRDCVQKSLESSTRFFLVKTPSEAIDYCNQIAPGALCLHLKSPQDYVSDVRACGALFLGSYSPPTAIDITGGATGLEATLGSAESHRSLSPAAFCRRFASIEITREALEMAQKPSVLLSESEGYVCHDESFRARLLQ